jgi:putative ABC transport system permease protein
MRWYNSHMMLRSTRVGFFLMVRYLRRANPWTSLLIVGVMFLTFLNVVVVRGVLVGLPVGASVSYQNEYAGAVLITSLSDRRHIERSTYIENVLSNVAGYETHTARYLAGGVVRANFDRPQRPAYIPDQVGTTVAGIDPFAEDRVTGLSSMIVEGRYLTSGDTKGVLVGSQLLDRYSGDTPDAGTPGSSGALRNVYPGDTVRIIVGDVAGEYTVLGVVSGKVGQNSRRVFMLDSQLRKVLGRGVDSKDEMAVILRDGTSATAYVRALHESGLGEYATIQTARDSQGQFLDDITSTFELLGAGIGLIGIVVAAITVFIMIFIVALNRQKQIGILKGIGVSTLAIELSYVFLSITYAAVGISLGVAVLYLGIAPYVAANPIDFPFADGILVAPWNDTFVRSVFLVSITLLAGYLPARMIVQKNTINAILGR